MCKAILIIDMPDNCKDCPCAYMTEGCFWDACQAMQNKQLENNYEEKKPSWCPLREMPQKKEEIVYTSLSGIGEKKGWNACIDAILKEGAE